MSVDLLNGLLIVSFCLAGAALALEQTVCEHLLGTLNCPSGEKIQINSVLYGRTKLNTCNFNNQPIQNLNCHSTSISTRSVENSCQGRSTCIVLADNSFLKEDPCPSVQKYLQVKYQCVQNVIASAFTTAAPAKTTSIRQTTPTTTQKQPSNFPANIITPGAGGGSKTTGNTSNSGAAQCHEYLVSGPRGVPDSQMSNSSQSSLSSNAHRARLYTGIFKYPTGFFLEGGWTADPADSQPWLQLKMNWLTMVTGIALQGRHVNQYTGCCSEWVTGFKVRYSLDAQGWDTVKDTNGQDKVFVGNTDTDTVITHVFDCPFVARFVRVEVVSFHGKASMRLELLGCPTNAGDLGVCPKGWKQRPGSGTCYYISDQNDKKTWERAMLACKWQHGEAVKIDSVQEKQWLENEIQSLSSSQKLQSWWTGLNNRPRVDNLDFKWHDGTPLDQTILRWDPSEPNNAGGIEHCAAFHAVNHDLNDLDCDLSLPYICERPKYWLAPRNTPNVVTLQPPTRPPATTQSTLAPATITVGNKVPIPVGGNVVTSGQTTFFTGCLKPLDCVGRAWDDYPSCTGCGYYLTCAPNNVYDRQCAFNLKYDANSKACTFKSSTCTGP